MKPVNRLLRRAVLWIHFKRFIEVLLVCITAGAGAVLLLRAGERLIGIEVNWATAWIGAMSLALILALAYVVVTRRRRLAVARLLDDAAHLKESISTALSVQGRSDPWSQAAVAHAARLAPGVPIARTLPIRVRRWWVAPAVIVGLFFLAGLAPQLDLLKLLERAQARENQEQELVQAQQQTEAAEDRLKDVLAQVGDGTLSEPEINADAPAPKTPDDIRRASIKKLTRIQDRLSALRSKSDASMLDQLKKKMAQLRPSTAGDLDSLTNALRKGDFRAAKAELDRIAQQLSSGKFTEEQRQAIQQQLAELAKQLQVLAEQQKELEQALARAGLDPNLAGDPEALRKALEQAQNLTPEQRQALQRLAQANAAAAKKCQGLADGAGRAAQMLREGAAGGLGQLAGQLTDLEMLQGELASMDAAQLALAGELGGLCNSLGPLNNSLLALKKWNDGKGGREAGYGTGENLQDPLGSPADLTKVKVRSKLTAGPIVGSTFIQGEQVRGESVQQFADAVEAGAASAADAVESKRVPRDLHDAVKAYFGRLEREGKGAAAPGADEPSGEK